MISRLRDWTERMSSGLTFWRGVFIVIMVMALYAAVIRFTQGLGAATHLSDSFPWGLWIGFDVLVGVGLAAGGFVLAATVHIFRIERFKPIVRPTVLTAFLGYLLVIFALLFDLGRPYRIWHPLIMWNPHSVMFEVGWCVTLYTTVLAVEFSPLVFERFGLKKPLKVVRAIFVPLVIVGVLLSTLHQSSLGTFYVIAPDKLHGLWYTPMLPVFFFISAVAGGLSMVIFESFMSRRAFGKELEHNLLSDLARVSVVVLAFFTLWRLEDLIMRGNFHLIFTITPESTLFWGEMALGAILPLILFSLPRVRRSESGLFFAATLTVLGFIMYRLNVSITGMTASSGAFYVPSWMEFSVTIGVVALGFALFGLAVKHLPVFPSEELEPARERVAGIQPRSTVGILKLRPLLALWALLLIGVVVVFQGSRSRIASAEQRLPDVGTLTTLTDSELTLPAAYTFPTSEMSPGPVTFDHYSHVDPAAPDCWNCHTRNFSLLESGKPRNGALSYERIHEEDLCVSCHDGTRAFSMEEDCMICHRY